MPKVYPTHAEYSLIAEGYIDEENNIFFYDQEPIIKDIHPLY